MKNKKLLSIVLTVVMLVSMFSVGIGGISASAEDDFPYFIFYDIVYGNTLNINSNEIVTNDFLVGIVNDIISNDLENGTNVVNDIEEIKIDRCSQLTDISILFSTFPNVKVYYSSACPIDAIAGISQWNKLEKLTLSGGNLVDISEIFKCKTLTSLYVSSSEFTSIKGISECSELTYVHLSYNGITDISELYLLEKLETINLVHNNISDITGLKEFCESSDTIRYVYIDNNPLADYNDYLTTLNNNKKISLTYIPYSNLPSDGIKPEDIPMIEWRDTVTVDNEKKIITIDCADGRTSTSLKRVSSSKILNYSIPTDDNVSFDSKYYIYYIYKPNNADSYTTTIMVNTESSNPVEYTLVVNFYDWPGFELDAVNLKNAKNSSFDSETLTFTVNSEGSYVRIYKDLSNGMRIEIDESYDFITEHTYFYQVNKVSKTVEFDVSVYYGDDIKAVVNFLEKAFEADELTVKNATETSFDAENSALTIDSEGTYVRVYKVLANGATVKVNADDYDFITEHDNFYHINKLALKASDLNTASFEMTTGNGDVINTAVNFVTKAPEFEASKLTIKNATNTSFDEENSALTIDSEGTYVRVYKTLANGSTVKVNVDDYDFITEHDNFYHINKLALKTSDLNIASFEMTTDSGDTISTKVNFPNAGVLPLEKFKITNYDSLTIDGNEINIDIVDTKTYSRIFKTVADGTTLTIESDNVYVEEREDCYVLRQRAVGATITMTYGENTYTINLTK